MQFPLLLLLLLLPTLLPSATADIHALEYETSDPVKIWLNKAGPYENPQETYAYFTLPFCKAEPDKWEKQWAGLGEALEGNELVLSDYEVKFGQDVPPTVVCAQELASDDVGVFEYALDNHYWYQIIVDELPVWGMVGEVTGGADDADADEPSPNPDKATELQYKLFTHRHFDFAFNGNRIIEVNLSSSNPVQLTAGSRLDFSYSVTWKQTDASFDDRFKRYLDDDFFEHQIHWFSIFNSFMMVLFLVGVVALILVRTVKSDYARISSMDDEEGMSSVLSPDMHDDCGWKQVQSDVFRPPSSAALVYALVGSGVQLISLSFLLSAVAAIGTLYTGRGHTTTAFVVCYALTSSVAGFVSGSLYKRARADSWIRCLVLTCTIMPVPVVAVALSLNFIAIAYKSLAAIPFGTMIIMLSLWLFISCPLAFAGTILGRHCTPQYEPPCRVSVVPRLIPQKNWRVPLPVVLLLAGSLSFGSVFIEMYFVFTSFWNYKFYYVYGFMCLMLVILIIVVSCTSVVVVYFTLNAEDYRWQWTSFVSGALSAVFLFLYSVYYFAFKTRMYGFFQTVFYFGSVSQMCLAFALMCGAAAYFAASTFVTRIYGAIKSD